MYAIIDEDNRFVISAAKGLPYLIENRMDELKKKWKFSQLLDPFAQEEIKGMRVVELEIKETVSEVNEWDK